MASLKTTMTGNLSAQREASASKFFGRKIKSAGSGSDSFPSMSKVRLAMTDAVIGSLPKGSNTVGGVVGGLNSDSDYQGIKAGK